MSKLTEQEKALFAGVTGRVGGFILQSLLADP
ncbi:hypothetical protein AZZ82_004199 [Klebsiella aerogenes]|nr:hypothetical protein AZZ82_004199 [Klebsiella aerogenes]